MAWTAPKTWVTGEVVLRSDWTTHFRLNQEQMMPHRVTTKGDIIVGTGDKASAIVPAAADGKILAANSSTTSGVEWQDNSVPSGAILLKVGSGDTCPSGWSEYTAARGFAIVGTPDSGTQAGTVGTALTNLQVKTHVHTQTLGHRHNIGGSTTVSSVSAGATRFNATVSDYSALDTTTDSSPQPQMPYIQVLLCQKD